MDESSLLENLNKAQKEAVLATEGPVMVMAGAGSGKTRVLTRRIAYLILEKEVSPFSILAVTFTNKAAREMKERVAKLVNINADAMWISTFHSFCCRLLRQDIEALEGYRRSFQIIDEDDSLKIIKTILKENSIEDTKPKEMKNLISKFKNGEVFEIKNNTLREQYDLISNEYDSYLMENNLLDFDDLILVTLKLFKNCPNVLRKYQNKFNYILVDEFQDTNTVQYTLMHLLALNSHNIFVVGDEDQSIYSFRGAKIENINLFRKDFLETKIILLEENYRSTKEILDIANNVIGNNSDRIKKNLHTINSLNEKPYYYYTDRAYDEVVFVVDKIRQLMLAGYSYSDFAIMYRSNFLSRNFEDALVKYQIPYIIYGGTSFYNRKEIKDVLAYIRLVIDNNDNFSFERIVNEPKRKIGDAIISKLKIIADIKDISLFEAISYYEGSGMGYTNLKEFYRVIKDLYTDISEGDINKVIDIVTTKTGYYDYLNSDEDLKDRLENVKELKTVIKEADEFYEGSNIEKLISLLSDIALRTDVDNVDDSLESVKLMTYHQAKGLEFRVVFMVAMEQGIFPSINAYTDKDVAEERRICYVGITRAKEKLYLTCCGSRFIYGVTQNEVPSVFIAEMGKENLKNISKDYSKPKTYTNYYDDEDDYSYKKRPVVKEKLVEVNHFTFKVSDKINHKAFGPGVVVAVDDDIITVAFNATYGIKKLKSNHPSISKIE